MAADIASLDAHELPPDFLRGIWKTHSKANQDELLEAGDVDDLERPEKAAEFCVAGSIPAERLAAGFSKLVQDGDGVDVQVDRDAPIYYHPIIPGEYRMVVWFTWDGHRLTSKKASSSSQHCYRRRCRRLYFPASSTET